MNGRFEMSVLLSFKSHCFCFSFQLLYLAKAILNMDSK